MDFFVNMHNGINNHYSVDESEYAAEGVNWPATMAQLADRHCRRGPQGYRLEINSHGSPAQILLQPHVTLQNIDLFAGLVRRLLKPGSAIEVLSCSVAAFPAGNVAAHLASATKPASTAMPSRELVLRGAARIGPRLTVSGPEVRLLAMRAIATGKELLFPAGYAGGTTLFPGTSKYAALANGPLFCTRLAKLTRSTVRAGMIEQREEGENSGNVHFNTPIGHWEGHVLDFVPNGDVRYVGFNVRRPVFRTHDEHGDGPLRLA